MGNRVRHMAAGAITLTLASCTGLTQSSLVYSSQNNIGVVIKGGSAQAGNVDLTLGYSGHDFAIVPVAVAETCSDLAKEDDCDAKKYRLVKIEGSNNVDAAAQAMAALASQLSEQSQIKLLEKRDLVARLNQMDEKLAIIGKIDDLRVQIKAEEANLKKQEDEDNPVDDSADPEYVRFENARSDSISKINQKLATFRLQEAEAEALSVTNSPELRKAIQAKIDEIDAMVAANENKLDGIIKQAGKNSTDLKNDALSVYGEFGGSTHAQGAKASLQVGKVFSTGVAAQNLTQQMGAALAARERVKCVVAAIDFIQRDDRLDKLDEDVLASLYSDAMILCGERKAESEG